MGRMRTVGSIASVVVLLLGCLVFLWPGVFAVPDLDEASLASQEDAAALMDFLEESTEAETESADSAAGGGGSLTALDSGSPSEPSVGWAASRQVGNALREVSDAD